MKPASSLSQTNVPRTAKASLDRETPRKPSLKWVRAGRMRPMILLWALGIPIPLLLIFFLLRGCG